MREDVSTPKENDFGRMLSARIESPQCKIKGISQICGERDSVNSDEVVSPTTVRLPFMEKIPPYTTWMFLDKNQRMAEDQSVVGRRRIYYDPHGSEALICSDSEEETAEPEEEKHEFSEVEDRILRMTFMEYGLDEEVLKILIQFVGGTISEIQDRCKVLNEQNLRENPNIKDSEGYDPEWNAFLGKRLTAALDSFDNLFCRRCLVFDCRLHGCSQVVINSTDKQSYSSDSEDEKKPCGEQCYLLARMVGTRPEGLGASSSDGFEEKPPAEDKKTLIALIPGEAEKNPENTGKRKLLEPLDPLIGTDSNNTPGICSKKSKPTVQTVVRMAVGSAVNVAQSVSAIRKDLEFSEAEENPKTNDAGIDRGCLGKSSSGDRIQQNGDVYEMPKIKQMLDFKENSDWNPIEKDLLIKGIEIFGRKSCLIARNLLPGLKTCNEVFIYLNDGGVAMSRGATAYACSSADDNGRTNMDCMESEMPARSRLLRKKGRTRKLKYSWKSTGHPSMWRRIVDEKNQQCKQYTPCGCQAMCGKQCPCLQNGTCCEKYCGCSKSCKNRFRGCHCAKSQCRSRQCPCFAAGRECDPDVCRNCWVSCGDAILGEPPRQGEGQCGNMRLLLRQQQRILLSKSDVAGWGAFLKNTVNKNDYLGEYTGELISHREADKRGKIYDRANSSFLFDLNEQYVLDAYRKGDKLKFANHSANPNCYAKVMLVAGDHRVGIFANERIEAGEELFYDYRYGPDQAPAWAKRPEGSKRDDSPMPQGRAKKHQSH
ncbi:OLC1v1004407C5 [Oldenlandia corymbosa var. corymbosa]|nr:OLC1v1004407C5 [Oldenlandia corymbosa var. corymbosa]